MDTTKPSAVAPARPTVAHGQHPRPGIDDSVLVTCRSFEEYLAFFDLTGDQLPSSVIDVSAGASSFVSEATRWSVRAVAVDPAYRDPGLLRKRVWASMHGGTRLIDAHSDRFVYDWYGSPAARHRMREHAMHTFLADIQEHPLRYLPAALPDLPFADRSFDLALCSHLLFTWADTFDDRWHLNALVEMVRVAKEVRVFPLVHQGDGRPVQFLDSLRDRLQADFGIVSTVDPVAYEFQRGARHMLRLRPR